MSVHHCRHPGGSDPNRAQTPLPPAPRRPFHPPSPPACAAPPALARLLSPLKDTGHKKAWADRSHPHRSQRQTHTFHRRPTRLCPPRRPLYYFLLPSYWVPSTRTSSSLLQALQEGGGGREAAPQEGAADQDVLTEEAKMRALLQHRTGGRGPPQGQGEGQGQGRPRRQDRGLSPEVSGSRGSRGLGASRRVVVRMEWPRASARVWGGTGRA